MGKHYGDEFTRLSYVCYNQDEDISIYIFKKGNSIISIDCKKKELPGNFKNNGVEWQAKGGKTEENVYDFLSLCDQ